MVASPVLLQQQLLEHDDVGEVLCGHHHGIELRMVERVFSGEHVQKGSLAQPVASENCLDRRSR